MTKALSKRERESKRNKVFHPLSASWYWKSQYCCQYIMSTWLVWLSVTVHQHIQFGHKEICTKENIGLTNSQWSLNLPCDHDHNSPVFDKTLMVMMHHKSQYDCKRVCISTACAFTVTLTITNQSFGMTLTSLWWCITIPNLVTKGSVGSEGIIWTNIHWYSDPALWPKP